MASRYGTRDDGDRRERPGCRSGAPRAAAGLEPVIARAGGVPPVEPDVEDAGIGAFSSTPPWVVRPETMSWREGIDSLRRRQRRRVPELIRRRSVPPFRLVRVVLTVGWAVAAWWATARIHGRKGSRSELAHRLRIAFEALGATFVKLGQVVASADGMLPAELVSEFKRCRDQVAPAPFPRVRAVLEAELGMPLADCFAEFDERPLAAASIAQVHAARLTTGQEVVVKVQRPGLDRIVERDLAAMSWVVPILGKRVRLALLANMPAYLELFAETIIEELDFRLEAQNMLDVAALLARSEDRPVVVPRPHPELVTRRVLVMEPLRGFKIDDDEAILEAGIDPTPVFRSLLVSFFEGALVYGVFHGDLHGGNMMVTADGRLGIFDFGITGRLSGTARAALLQLLIGGTTNDVQLQLRAFAELGGFPPAPIWAGSRRS